MSSQYFGAEVVNFYDSYRTAEFVYLASTSLILYDYLSTFDSEVDLFWFRKITGATALFFAARYTTLLYVLLSLVNFSISREISDEYFPSCDMLLKAYVVVQTCQYIPWAAFAGMRAYALSKRWTIFLVILVLSLSPFAVNFVYFRSLAIPVLARSGLIIADLGLVLVTWRSVAFGPLRTVFGRQSFTSIMLWNGIIYAMVLLVLNIFVLSFSLASIFGTEGASYLIDFSEPLTYILITRFLLQLQQANKHNVKLASDHPLHLSLGDNSPSFARVLGSIGATIMPEDT
ncbi:hypothetical protein K466DRAFT_663593 [Polyporus arcularius HHB13444]|uniref:DUF6533 domain-containing protein n=1 Tax=Polyporus arcularius HHB13444 TaxID=1314778 RepID=A0A5C3PEK8_9APHY|nr:hypothetical protein K466DRAFT_663593 [Polyporus arcularius HHB13444]